PGGAVALLGNREIRTDVRRTTPWETDRVGLGGGCARFASAARRHGTALHLQIGRAGRDTPLPADREAELAALVLVLQLELELHVRGRNEAERLLTRLEAHFAALQPLGERRQVFRDLVGRCNPRELESILGHRALLPLTPRRGRPAVSSRR